RWSPDGRWIAFRHNAEGRSNTWIIDAEGGTPRQLTNSSGESGVASFSHDGKWIYFASSGTSRAEVFRMPVAGGPPSQLTRNGGSYPLESPDGKTLYFVRSGRVNELFQMPAGGGEELSVGLKLIQDAYEVMPDGIYYIAATHENRYRGGELRFYDFA